MGQVMARKAELASGPGVGNLWINEIIIETLKLFKTEDGFDVWRQDRLRGK